MELNRIYNENLSKRGPRKGYEQTEAHKQKKADAKKRGRFFGCEICQKDFWRKPSEIKKGITRFCSIECYTKWQIGREKEMPYRPHVVGARNPNWKGGITPEHKKIRSSRAYRNWRKAVLKRDDFTCRICGAKSDGSGRDVILNADHIKPFADYPELRLEVENGRTLCLECHKQTPNYGWKSSNAKRVRT